MDARRIGLYIILGQCVESSRPEDDVETMACATLAEST